MRERAHEPLRDAQRVRLVADALAQHGELVAAEAGDHVVRAQHGAQARADRPQQLVAGVVAERVVEHLQVVDVEEEQGEAAALGVGARDRLAEALHQQRAVREAGERVVQRVVADALLRALALDGAVEHVRDRGQEVEVLGAERASRRR